MNVILGYLVFVKVYYSMELLDRLTRSSCKLIRIILNRVIDHNNWGEPEVELWNGTTDLTLSLYFRVSKSLLYADNVVVGVSAPSVISSTLLLAHTLFSCTFYHLFIAGRPVIAQKRL